MPVTRSIGRETAYVLDADGEPVDARRFRDLLVDAHAAGATILVVPVARFDAAFFDLRSGVAGDLLQASVVYGMPMAIVGALPDPAASSVAFNALVRESNRGRQHAFLPSMEALAAHLARG